MTLVKQIETILDDFIGRGGGDASTVTEYAEKIAALTDDNGATLAAAALENEVTSTLMDMLAATILATLINEEGGGRTNVSFSPMSMKELLADWTYEVETDGLIRTVRIKAARPDEWEEGNGDDLQAAMVGKGLKLSGLGPVVDSQKVHPQALPKEHNRPLWAIRYIDFGGNAALAMMHDHADAARHLDRYGREDAPLPEIQNRWCDHPDCPTTGCAHDKEKRDPAPEVTPDA